MAASHINLALPEGTQIELEKGALAAGVDVSSFILNAIEEKLEQSQEELEETPPYDEWRERFRAGSQGNALEILGWMTVARASMTDAHST